MKKILISLFFAFSFNYVYADSDPKTTLNCEFVNELSIYPGSTIEFGMVPNGANTRDFSKVFPIHFYATKADQFVFLKAARVTSRMIMLSEGVFLSFENKEFNIMLSTVPRVSNMFKYFDGTIEIKKNSFLGAAAVHAIECYGSGI